MTDHSQNSEFETEIGVEKGAEITAELEARIAALVLGEASDLEADQLQRLIDARPELAALKARFEAVHGLLREIGAGEEAVQSEPWKLPTQMRSKLLAVIDGESQRQIDISPVIKPVVAPGAIKPRVRWRHSRLVALLCVAGCLGMFALSGTFLLQSKTAIRATALASNRRLSVAAVESPAKGYAMPQLRGVTEFSADSKAFDSGLTDAPVASSPLLAIRESLATETAAPNANYFNDDVQYFRNVAPAEPMIGESVARAQSEPTPASPAGPSSSDLKTAERLEYEARDAESAKSNAAAYKQWSVQDREQPNADTRFHYLADPQAALAEGKNSNLGGIQNGGFAGGMGGMGAASSAGQSKGGGGYGRDATAQDLSSLLADEKRSRFGSGSEPSGDVSGSNVSDGRGGQVDNFAGRELSELESRVAGVGNEFNKKGLTRPEVAGMSDVKNLNGVDNSNVDFFSEDRERVAQGLSRQASSLPSPDNQAQLTPEALSKKNQAEVAATNSSGVALFSGVNMPVVEEVELNLLRRRGSQLAASGKEEGAVAEFQIGQAPSDGLSLNEKNAQVLAGKPFGLFDTDGEKAAVAFGLELQPAPATALGEKSQSKDDLLALGDVRRGESLGRLPKLEDKSENLFNRRAAIVPSNLNETNAAAESFSTFSLHISDVSFQLAQAALAGGKWPEANQVRIEEFVNAFDYGDPLPNKHESVACIVEQAIHPSLQQRNVMRVSLRTAATGRASHTPLRLTLVLDNSGSMERSDRQQMVRRAFALLAQQLTAQDQVTLISFARRPRLLADKISGDKSPQLVKLIQGLPSEGGTNIEAALQLAFEKAREQHAEGAQSRIVLLTDGAVNLGDANPDSLSQMITSIRDSGIAFDAAGISAEGLNDEILEALARQGDGRYYLLDANEAADDGFARQIAGALRPSAKNVKVQIEFNPQRVGRYKLLGFEKHLLKQEDFRNDQVDAAELAAAEAGVAVYQFEAKPNGEGDVGSVSVRFQDLATGQMVENRWPIPYLADAPQATQAAPALRIASTAALLAAKLRGDALGETIEFKTLADLIAGLPTSVRQATRVEQLQQMIEQARQLSGN